MASYRREVSHSYEFIAAFVDDRKAGNPVVVVGILTTRFVKESAINLVDDFQVPGQNARKEWQGPLLQCLRQQSMVCICKSLCRNTPCRIPVHAMDVDKQPHQLSYSDRRMCIVQLDCEILIQLFEAIATHALDPDEILQRAGC